MKHPKYYDSQKEATARYNKKAYDRINIIIKKRPAADHQGFCCQSGQEFEPLRIRCY
jgi:hypothetical protein